MVIAHFELFFEFIFALYFSVLVSVLAAADHFLILLLLLDLLILVPLLLMVVYSTIRRSDYQSYSFAIFLLGVAASDTAVGLGLFIVYFKATGEVSIKDN